MMRQKIATLLIFPMAFLILTSHYSWSQEKIDYSNLPESFLKRISVNLTNVTFEDALDFISKKENIQLNFNRSRLPIDQVVTVIRNNSRVIDILEYLVELTNTELKTLSGNQILIVPRGSSVRTGSLFGKIIDFKNQRPLIGTNVFMEGYRIGDATNVEGGYRIENIPVGSYTVKISYIGYQTVSIPDVIIKSDRVTFLNVELRESAVLGEQVLIEDNFFAHLEVQPTSSANFSAEEIRRAATIGGDVSRVINGLPSLSNENEGNHIIARGGSTLENSFYLDNIQVPNINHFQFPGTSGGAFSLLNIDYVNDINVYSGGFSSQYGDRLSSVLDIKYRDGNKEEFDGQVDLNFIGITGQVEGPINNGLGSWMLSSRYGSTQFVAHLLDEEEQPSSFYDIQGKVVYSLSPNHQISLIDIYSRDDWQTPKKYSVANFWNWYGNFNTEQNILGFSWKYLWSNNGFSHTTVSHLFNSYRTNFFTTATDEERIDYNNSEHILQLKNTNYYEISPEYKIEFGIESSFSINDHNDFVSSGVDLYGIYKPELNVKIKLEGLKAAGYISTEWRPIPQLKLTPGLRIDYFDYNDNLTLSPRFSTALQLNEQLSISGSIGIYHQFLPAYMLVQDENFKNVRMPSSNHYILGLNYLLAEDIKLSIEYYYKDYRDLLFDANLPGLYLLDEPINNLFMGDHANLVNGSKANSNGIEIMIQKKMSDNFYGLASLTFFSCKYRDLNGIWRSRITDNRILAALEGGYKPDEEWEFSLRLGYAGGVPYTPFDKVKSAVFGNGVFDINRINTLRLPHYMNVSVRVDKRFHFSNSNLILYLSIWNLFDRENVSIHGWSEQYNLSVDYKLISIVPVIGVEFEF